MQARAKKGQWLLRIDDLDIARNVKGANDLIFKTLDSFGLHWDGRVSYQSEHHDLYAAALTALDRQNLLYPCFCSRKTLSNLAGNSLENSVYPGFCRNKNSSNNKPHALRIKTHDAELFFDDNLQLRVKHNLAARHGDFIVKRKDAIIAYQLAVVVDDHTQQITEVVRGADLLASTIKQIYLQQQLGYTSPEYMHVPVIIDQQGCKLSKQTFAQAVDLQAPQKVLFTLLTMLKQKPPGVLKMASVQQQLSWAVANWNPEPLKKIVQIV